VDGPWMGPGPSRDSLNIGEETEAAAVMGTDRTGPAAVGFEDGGKGPRPKQHGPASLRRREGQGDRMCPKDLPERTTAP
jgi:hypothetical protein